MGGCISNTLGLSNTLSELVESVCMAIETPYEVISSEDMLSRISDCNKKIGELRDLKVKGTQSLSAENAKIWDWRQEYILLGTDVSALFPTLSAKTLASNSRWRQDLSTFY